jgi:NAD(P)-dependent dehydrogenase (short-subunit alcohol dehydrogenase family)
MVSLIGESIMTDNYPFSVSGEEFKDKRVLVTGGTKGVGEAIVRRFRLSGALVATTARAPSPHGQTANLLYRRISQLLPAYTR